MNDIQEFAFDLLKAIEEQYRDLGEAGQKLLPTAEGSREDSDKAFTYLGSRLALEWVAEEIALAAGITSEQILSLIVTEPSKDDQNG